MERLFHKSAAHFSKILGSTWGFVAALALILGLGFYTSFTEKWTVESIIVIITFLLLFFIQHTQNVNDRATHLKLDEIIRALEGARNEVTAVEEKEEHLIEELRESHPDVCNDQTKQAEKK